MEIVLLIIIGLIAKNFKAILEFLAEQGQQYGPPPIVKNPGQPNLSKKAPTDFSYEDDYYSEEENSHEPKTYKVKNSQTEFKNDSSNNLEKSTIRENKNSYLETSGITETSFKEKTNLKKKSNFKEDTDENLIQLDDLKKGVIWQEILEPPRARRPYGKIN